MKNINRRDFFKTTAATALGASALIPGNPFTAFADDKTGVRMPKRRLGKTGYKASIVSLGGQSTLEQSGTREESVAIINRALDLGINYIDTAEAYGGGTSETHIGEVMKNRRDEVFLTTKTRQRTREGIEEERFVGSCDRLHTDHIDLYFFHNVGSREDLHTALDRDNGAVCAFENLREKGRIGNIGISTHSTEILEEALDMYDFDCIFLTLNPAGMRMNQSPKKTREFLQQASGEDIGVIAMKLAARNDIFERDITMEQSLRYALSAGCVNDRYPINTAAIGITTIDQIDENVKLAGQYRPCDDSELDRLESVAKAD